jgi:uncharacterized membrane protein YgcG
MRRLMIPVAAMAAVGLIFSASTASAQGQGQGRGRGLGGGRRGGFAGPRRLLQMPTVQAELKLQPAQIELLKGLNAGTDRQSFRELRNLPPAEQQKRFTEMRQAQEKKVAEILDAKQVARLKELELQLAGNRAVERPDVAAALKLTVEQKSKIDGALAAERDSMTKLRESLRGAQATDDQRRQAMQKFRDTRAATDAAIAGALTEAQKSQLKAMQGAPFAFPRGGGQRGGGQRGGGRRGGGGAAGV